MTREPGPYEILRLPADAGVNEVIERARRLARETMDGREQQEYRRAVEAIRQHPAVRAQTQFWEPPAARYEDEVLADFCLRHGREPVRRSELDELRRRFERSECSPAALAELAVPRIPAAPDVTPPSAALADELPEPPLEPWELFL